MHVRSLGWFTATNSRPISPENVDSPFVSIVEVALMAISLSPRQKNTKLAIVPRGSKKK